MRCRFVLQACPYLQHFELCVEVATSDKPSHEDTFALLPCLRSLSLSHSDKSSGTHSHERGHPHFEFKRMLDSLPCLISLRCTDIHMDIGDLLIIASHSTLEELDLLTTGGRLVDYEWIGNELRMPISVADDVEQLGRAPAPVPAGNLSEEETESEARTAHLEPPEVAGFQRYVRETTVQTTPADMAENVQRMQAALTRTQPTRRSCESRLALADWLHRRLRRGGLRTGSHAHPSGLLRHHRQQVALLRATLQQQLTRARVVSGGSE